MCRAFVWEQAPDSVFVYADNCPKTPDKIREVLDSLYDGLAKLDKNDKTTTEQVVYRNGEFIFIEIRKGGLGGVSFLFQRILKKHEFELFPIRPPANIVGRPSFFTDADNPDWVLTPSGWVRRKS